MTDPFRLEILANRNLSLLGVCIGMKKDVTIFVLKKFNPKLFDTGITISNTCYNISYDLDEYGFICGICIGICDNGKDKERVECFVKYHKKLLRNNYTLSSKKEDEKDGEKSISEYYSSGVLRIKFFVDENVKALSGRNSGMIKVSFALGRDFMDKPLNGESYAASLYGLLDSNSSFSPKLRQKFQFKIERNTIYIFIVCFSLIVCMFIYAFSHRYQVVYSGSGIIDKWTGTLEEVKYKK